MRVMQKSRAKAGGDDAPPAIALPPPAVALYRASVDFGAVKALNQIDLRIEDGEFITILGPSGCGKSTLLRLISDLVPPSAGAMSIFGDSTEAARLARQFAFVFQSAALLPWRTAVQNVRLPLEMGKKMAKKQGRALPVSAQSPEELLEFVGLKGRENAWPHELSGGMQQRVAIARALICKPKLLLMDEPFGALDEMTRDHLNLQLLDIWKKTGVTIVFVTHSIPEAVLLAQKVVMMKSQPGAIKKIIPIDLPAKRKLEMRDTAKFNKYAAQLRKLLGAH